MPSHGTPSERCTSGQLAKITSRLVLALPKAIKFSGLSPKEVLKWTGHGEPLERAVGCALQMLYSGHAEVAVPNWNVEPYTHDQLIVYSHVDNGSWRWDPDKVELWPGSLPEDATVEMLVDATVGVPVLNATVAEHLVLHEHDVPSEWDGKYVAFPGTIFKCPRGGRYLASIYCSGTKRSQCMLSLSDQWHPDWVAAILKSEEV